jgi:hypothetical protein
MAVATAAPGPMLLSDAVASWWNTVALQRGKWTGPGSAVRASVACMQLKYM